LSPYVKQVFFKLTNDRDSELEACEYLENFASKCGFAKDEIDEMKMAFIEAIVNAKEHSIKDTSQDSEGAIKDDVDIGLEFDGEDLTIKIRDYGKGFDPNKVDPNPTLAKKMNSSYKRGWGLMLMTNLMDGVKINSMPPQGTLITLVKKVPQNMTLDQTELLVEKRRVERLQYILGSIIDLSSFLCRSQTLQKGLRSMLRILLGTLGISRGAIYLYDSKAQELNAYIDIKFKSADKLPKIKINDKTELDALLASESVNVTNELTKTFPQFAEKYAPEELKRSYLLKIDNTLHGVLLIGNKLDVSDESDYDEDFLIIMARNIASAIHTYQIMEQLKISNTCLERTNKELNALSSTTQLISADPALEKIPVTLKNLFTDMFAATKFSFAFLDPTEKKYIFSKSDRPNLPVTLNLWDSPVSKYVIETKRPLLVKNIDEEERFEFTRANSYSSKSFMILPIILDNEVTAIMSLTDRQDNHHFTEEDFNFAKMLISQLSVLMKNADTTRHGMVDSLTALYSDAYFYSRLEQEIYRIRRTNTSLSLLLIAVDNLDEIAKNNEALNDEIIKSIASKIKRIVRFNDIPCRLQGNRIAVIMPDTLKEGAQAAAKKIFAKIKQSLIEHNGKTYDITVSIETELYDKSMELTAFLEAAKKNLYNLQKTGGDRISE